MAPFWVAPMRHINYVLKPATIDNAKPKDKRYDLTDGGGLVLEVMPSGSKTWRFKYHLNGKREKVTIGVDPAFTIKQARDRHEVSELTTISSTGQVTVPREVRERLGLQAGDKIAWSMLGNGTIVLRPKTRRLADLVGILTQPGQPGVSADEMRLPE